MRCPTGTAVWRRLRVRSGRGGGSGGRRAPRISTLAVRFVFSPRIGRSPGLESAVVAFDSVVLVLAGVVQGGRKQPLNYVGQRRRPVGDDLCRVAGNSQGGGEERARGGDVPTL